MWNSNENWHSNNFKNNKTYDCETFCEPKVVEGIKKYRQCSPICEEKCPGSMKNCIEKSTNSSTSAIKSSECKKLTDIACDETSKCFSCWSKTDKSKNCIPFTNIPDLTKKCIGPIKNIIDIDDKNIRIREYYKK